MLVLTRRPGESCLLGEDIKVTVVSIRGNQVQLGFDADQNIRIHRTEVYERIKLQGELSKTKSNGAKKCYRQHVTM